MMIERIRRVTSFLFLWLLAWVFWTFLIRTFAGHHSDNPAVQGLAVDTVA